MERAELRNAWRYELSLPVTIHAPAEERAGSCNGRTRDISTRGVYFTIENDLKLGTALNLTMTVPVEITGGTDMFIHVTGKVVRVEDVLEINSQKIGVAVTVDHYEIGRSDKVPS